MSIARYIKVIGRGREGARSLDREQAHDLMSQVLDGRVTDLEIGAFALAMRIKGEIGRRARRLPRRRAGALHRHPQRPADRRPAVVQRLAPAAQPDRPAGDAAGAARRAGAGARPVRDPTRVTTAEIFHDLGLTCANDARRRSPPPGARREPAFIRHRRALPAAGAAARGAPGRRPAQLRPHGRQAARRLQRRADAARRQLHPSGVRARCWPSFLAADPRRRAADARHRRRAGRRRAPPADGSTSTSAASPGPSSRCRRRTASVAELPVLPRSSDAPTTARCDPGDRQRRDAGAGADRPRRSTAWCARSARSTGRRAARPRPEARSRAIIRVASTRRAVARRGTGEAP